jgi:DNA adenine methylase
MTAKKLKGTSAPKPRVLRSPVLWVGGKGSNFGWITSQMPKHLIYVEPFGGGASVLLNKSPVDNEIYNDLDKRLFDLFSVLRDPDQSKQLIRLLKKTLYHETEFHTAWANPLDADSVKRARQVFVQLRYAFGGFGSRGTKPGFGFAKSGSRALATKNCIDELEAITERLRTVTVMSRCGIDVIQRFDSKDTLHFCDPPYVSSTRTGSRDYIHEMVDDDHKRLIDVLRRVKGKVMLSGYGSQLYDSQLKNWRRVERTQALSCSRDKTQKRTEVLWMNFEPDNQT